MSTSLGRKEFPTSPDRYFGVPEAKAESLRGLVEANIVRMLQVTDITDRNEVRHAWDVISDLGKNPQVESEHVRRVLNLVGGGSPRMPLLGKVWGIINLCEASANFTPEQAEFRREIWATVREAIQTEPDETNISQIILLGAWVAGLAYPEEDEERARKFSELISAINEKKARPENRWSMQVAAGFLSELLDAEQLRLGILTVKIQGGDKQEPEYRGEDLKKGYPDTIMILREGAIHSEKKLKEGVSLGVPSTGYLVRRPLKVMVGLQREMLGASSRVSEYPSRRWSFVTPGAYTHQEEELQPEEGQFVADGLTLWASLQAVDRVKNTFAPTARIRTAVRAVVLKLQEDIRLQMIDGSVEEVPGVLQAAVQEWNTHRGQKVFLSDAASQLVESATGLIVAASSSQHADGEHLVSGRSALYEVYKEKLWQGISTEDKLAFAQILFKEGSGHWNNLSKGDRDLCYLALNPDLWDLQTPEQQREIAQVFFESSNYQYARHISVKQQQIMRTVFGDELREHRFQLVASDVKRMRSTMLSSLHRELLIKSETIRDKAGEMGMVVFKEEEE